MSLPVASAKFVASTSSERRNLAQAGRRFHGALEAFGFAGLAIFEIWFAVNSAPWAVALPVVLMVWSWRRYSRSYASLGLRLQDFGRSFPDWWPLWISSTICVALLGGDRLFAPHVLRRASAYFLWCALQQLALQSMAYLPLRKSFSSLRAALLTGILFAAAHAPNPVLMPATLAWGAVAALLFERRRSVWGLALMQTLLSSLLLWLTPYRLNHGFRIGPFY